MALIRGAGAVTAALCALLGVGFVSIPASVLSSHSPTLGTGAAITVPLLMGVGAIVAGALYWNLARSGKAAVLGVLVALLLFGAAVAVAVGLDAAACAQVHFCAPGSGPAS